MRSRRGHVLFAFTITLLLCRVAAAAPPLQGRLESDFASKPFVTKIRLGSYVTFPMQNGSSCHQLIDTEFSPSKSIGYQARRGCVDFDTGRVITVSFDPNFYVAAGKLTGALEPGRTVWVTKIELKDDRIEFQLSVDPRRHTIDSYAKIKFMLGKGYDKWKYEQLVMTIAMALRVESYERILTLDTQFAELQKKLTEADGKYREATRAADKLTAAKNLRDILQSMAQNRSAYISTGRSAPDAASYLDRAASLDTEIKSLEGAARAERVQDLRAQLNANLAEAARLRALLTAKSPAAVPSNASRAGDDVARRSSTLEQYRSRLDERKGIFAALEKDGSPVAAADADALAAAFSEADGFAASLAEGRRRSQLDQLDAEYAQMAKRRVQLLDAYTLAVGSPQERSAVAALVTHLNRMHTNRVEADRLGSKSARADASRLAAEIDKFKKR